MNIDLKEKNAPAGMSGEDPDTGIKIYLREIGYDQGQSPFGR